MYKKIFSFAGIDPLWAKIISFCLIIFCIFFSDAILSYWIPTRLNYVYKDSLLVGFIIGASSLVGLITDLFLPQIIRTITVKKLMYLALTFSVFLPLILLSSYWINIILIYLLSMAIWGVYYELIKFAEQQFVADAIPLKLHASGWGLIGVVRSLAYFLGPLISSFIFPGSTSSLLFIAIFFQLIAFLILFLSKGNHERKMSIDPTHISFIREIKHWYTLARHVWPVVFLSGFLGIIDASFWTLGPVISENMSVKVWYASLFLPLYELPFIFMGFLIMKLKIYQGKKRLSIIMFLFSGILLSLISFVENNFTAQLILIGVSSILIASSYPLIDGVYSDIVARMGREREHMIGLTASAFSISYIIGPPLAGLIAKYFGELGTFGLMGYFMIFIALFLLVFTPSKLLLPQKEIKKWS